MAEQYLDFDLLIDRSGEAYKSRVLESPAGRGTAEFQLPFSSLELENYILRFGRPRRGMRRVESPEMEAIKTFGGRLFEAVFDGEAGRCFRNSVDEATRQGSGLRIRLRFGDAPDLINLPWEFLYNPAVNRFLCLSADTPVVRYLELPEVIQPLPVKPPLKIMTMISSPADYPTLDVEHEWANLKAALSGLEASGQVQVTRLEQPSLAALLPRIRKEEFHIFHFIGHGGFDPQAQDGLLIMQMEEGRGQPVSGQVLGTLLHDERTLRLAVLNACEGARTSSTDPFSGVAQSLVQQRIPAVIAMQFEVSDEAAIIFSRAFYTSLVDGLPVDGALSEARRAIFAKGNYTEWATPVLYTGITDGQIFAFETPAQPVPVEQPAPPPAPGKPVIPVPVPDIRISISAGEEESKAPTPEAAQVAAPVAAPVAVQAAAQEEAAAARISMPRWLPFTAGILLLFILGMIYFLMSGQGGSPESPTATLAVVAVQPSATSVPTAAVSSTAEETEEAAVPTGTGTPTSTQEPTETPTPSPSPTRAAGVTRDLGDLRTRLVSPQLTLVIGGIDRVVETATPTVTPTFAPGLDISAGCLSTSIWSVYPIKNQTPGGCWNLADRGFQVEDGKLRVEYPPQGSTASTYSNVQGIYYPIPSETTVQLKLQIDELVASGKGVLFIGVTPQIPVFDTQINLLHFQNEGQNQPVVLKFQDKYVRQPNGNFLIVEKGVEHEIIFELDGRRLGVFIDGTPAGDRGPLLRAPVHYLWIGYVMEGRSNTVNLSALISDLH
jgi:hypothetical protein